MKLKIRKILFELLSIVNIKASHNKFDFMFFTWCLILGFECIHGAFFKAAEQQKRQK